MTAQDLKNAILQLAVQGKLVPHDPNDEPVSELLKSIRAEKGRLIKEGKIKREKPLSSITEDEIPFDIPESWEWVRLGEISFITSGGTPSRTVSSYWGGDIPWVKISDISGKYVTKTEEKITLLGLESSSAKIFPKGTLLYTIFATIGTVGILDIDAATNQAIAGVTFYGQYNLDYLYYILLGLKDILVAKGKGMAQMNINQTILKNTPIPLPPLAEQQRIVAKIEELMPMVKEYGKAEERLASLNEEFSEKLKKSILQQAIQGKLTERDPADEPAFELLKRIKAEKEQLIKAGKIKKEKPFSPITEEEIPFEIPDGWIWVRIGDICSVINGDRGQNYPAKSTLSHTGIPFISALNLNGKTVINDDNLLCLSEAQYQKLVSGKLVQGDIVVCIRGSLGKHGRYPFEKGAIASSLVIMRSSLNTTVLDDYLMLYLDTPLFFLEIKRFDNGTAQPNLAAKSLERFLIPLPSLAEQQRIVDCVNELLAVCDALK